MVVAGVRATGTDRVADRLQKETETGGAPIWPALAAGVAGFALLAAIEVSSDLTGRAPAIRYAPPIHASGGAAAAGPEVTFIAHRTVQGVTAAFEQAAYDLEDIRTTHKQVPHLRLVMLPRDLPDVRDVGARKAVFISMALPLILEANARVALERRRLRSAMQRRASGQVLTEELKHWLAGLAKRYKVPVNRLDALLLRVDVVPPSLALAQAATESGWGTSRFAIEGNAIFGQWTTTGGKGLVPLERPEGMTYKVRSFDRLIESVNAYLLNLNTHRSYRGFRKARAGMRQAGTPLDGAVLAGELRRYSEKGQEYVDLLRGIIRENQLSPLDAARLGDTVIRLGQDA